MIRFNASNVPVVQATLNSKTIPEQRIFDYGLNFLRVKLFTILRPQRPSRFTWASA